MNVLSPELIWIEGNCYRVNDCPPELSSFSEYDLYEADSATPLEMEDDIDTNIEKTGVDKFTANFHIPRHYLGCIIGAKGSTKRRLESETKTSIKVPRMGQSGNIIITGATHQNVAQAKRRVNLIIMGARQKQAPTHFLSIPINSASIVNNFKKFKELVLLENAQGVDESVFMLPEKLHLTLGMMCLMDDEERLSASQLLSEVKSHIVEPLLNGRTLNVILKGISYMNDDPHSVHVLYGEVQELDKNDNILQTLVSQINDYFSQTGFMKKERNDQVKLHMTLINSKYRNENGDDNSETGVNKKLKNQPFDASQILEKHRDFDFGKHTVTEIHLSQRHAVGADGYYQPTCIITV